LVSPAVRDAEVIFLLIGLCEASVALVALPRSPIYPFLPFFMKDSVTLRSEHLKAEVECYLDEESDSEAQFRVTLHFEDGDELTFCGGCLPELLDLLTRVHCLIEDRKERSAN
jgi:hypothetical protein